MFNPATSGAKAFNATTLLREIDRWIEYKKLNLPKKNGINWGVLVHGNRILAAIVIKRFGIENLSQPIADFSKKIKPQELSITCEISHLKMVEIIEKSFSGKFLAVLFKNPSISKTVFDFASAVELELPDLNLSCGD